MPASCELLFKIRGRFLVYYNDSIKKRAMMKSRSASLKPLLCLLCLHGLPVLGQQGAHCVELNPAATPSHDFTWKQARWGSKKDFGLGGSVWRVRSIKVNPLPIFDESNPREDNFLFKWANAVHITTREEVLKDQLLFKEGDEVNEKMLAESERILRTRQYIGDAAIRILQECDDGVDVEIVTREVWTLTPEVSFKSTGGDSSAAIGIRDTNILGTGQFLSLKYKNNQERSSWGIAYKDPDIGPTHAQAELEMTNTSDGHHYGAQLVQPFYALNDKRSWKVQWESTDEILSQYRFGQRVTELEHTVKQVDTLYGISDGVVGGEVKRWSAGVHVSKETWGPGTALPAPAIYDRSLELNYPFVQFDYIEDNFVTAFNIGSIGRTEDLHVGLRWRNRLGYASNNAGQIIMQGELANTLLYRPGRLLQGTMSWDARWSDQSSRLENSAFAAALNYQQALSERRTLFLGLRAEKVMHLANGKQLELGGSNGLRGYDTHFLDGDGSVQFTVEQRYFTDYHWLQLARVGFAMFYDAGRIYGNTHPASGELFQDVGIGLRLTPSRSVSGQVVHIDLAWPLQRDVPGGTAGRQVAIELKNSF